MVPTVNQLAQNRFLIFDIESSGHHEGYIRHLISFFSENSKSEEVLIVAVGQELIGQLKQEFHSRNIIFRGLDEDLITTIKTSGLFLRSITEWKLFRNLVQELKPSASLLMYMDTLLLGMLLLPSAKSNVLGIYFRPHFHYPNQSLNLKERLSQLLKKLTLRLIFVKGSLQNLLALDASSIASLKEITGSAHIGVCPDPVERHTVSQEDLSELRIQFHLSETQRKIFLIFGYLDERKGIEATVAAIKLLNESELLKLHLVIAGTIAPSYQKKIEDLLAELPKAALITTHLEKISGKAIQFFFDASDVVLAVYQKHIGMSSILVRAAMSGKPVIADKYGLLGEIVYKKELGASVDSSKAHDLKEAIILALSNNLKANKDAQMAIAEQNSVSRFGQVIFDTLSQ
ncbi:MAG: glycosyltransferase involved in cell wall biosynthesis [Arcticibacterium sp.]